MAKDVQPTNMGELLAYFEERSRTLDADGQLPPDKPTQQFMSLIKFDGVSILPPVLSDERRKEMLSYKHEALKRQSQTRVKKREELHAKVQSIVAGVEERRAAKQASKAVSPASSDRSQSSTGKSSHKQNHTSEVVTRLSTKSPAPTRKSHVELSVNVSKGSPTTVSTSKASGIQTKTSSAKTSAKSSDATPSTKSSPKSSATKPSGSPAKSTFSNFKSLGKLGQLSKQKSFSSQHLDRSPSRLRRDDSDHSLSSEKDSSLSPNSKALLPHPPDGKPRYRNSPMRQSASTPDLRTIDISIKTEAFNKVLSSNKRSVSPKGGRPQAPDRSEEQSTVKKSEEKSKRTDQSSKFKPSVSKSKSNQAVKESEKSKEQKGKKPEIDKGKSSGNSLDRKAKQTNEKGIAPSKAKSTSSKLPLQNPLELLEQEITRMEESERNKNQRSDIPKQVVRQELDPIQTAAAELFPYPISEEQALATLDSLHSDFQSLDQADSLPVDYNGIPLTNTKQQQIIHMLTKLSKALNIEDTLTSTASSNVSDTLKENRQSQDQNQGVRQASGDNRSVQYGASKGYNRPDGADNGESYDDSYINVTNDSTTTAPSSGSLLSTSVSSNHSRARMSPTGSSSILSSASSVSASRSRMSPKTLKNTVHFSSFVTEISTSASQSYEDKISFRKLDITPKSSENFEDGAQSSPQTNPINLQSADMHRGDNRSESMLDKVALSPSVDSSTGSPGEFHGHAQPFEGFQEGDLNTSDKENEYVPQANESSDENSASDRNMRPTGRGQQVLNVYTANIPPGPIGENHPALMKSTVKSDFSESSTLKGCPEQISPQDNFSKFHLTMDTQFRYGTDGTELGKYMQKTASNSSTSSMQEEITRSYLMSQQKPERELMFAGDKFNVSKPMLRSQSHSPELDGSAILLKPIIYSHSQTSLETNRSMLEDEEKIRSNLDKVQLEESDEESSVDEETEKIERESETENTDNDDDNDVNDDDDDTEEDLCAENKVDIVTEQDDQEPQQTTETDLPEPIKNGEVEEEEEGKAEHIQKYLSQVHEQSLQHEDDFEDVPPLQPKRDVVDIGDLIQSFTSTIQSMNHLSQEDLFRIQAEQFDMLQKKLIEQQQAQLEELFVAQRREQMKLQNEIESYQQNIHQQDDIETIQLQESLRPQISQSLPQTTQAWQYHNQAVTMSPPFPVQPVASAAYGPNISGLSSNTSYSPMPYPDPRMAAQPCFQQPPPQGMYQDPRAAAVQGNPGMPHQYDPNLSEISHNTSYSTIPHHNMEGRGTKGVAVSSKPAFEQVRESKTSKSSNQFSYPNSPSQFTNPKDRDDVSEESGFTKATPKQLVFSNQSTPVPKIYKPILHSPVKKPSHQSNNSRPLIPDKVFDPTMQPKFDRVSAAVKGYLTRRLLKTEKVQEIIKTINDTRNFAFSFQSETPIKKGTYSREDMGLLERIVAQLQAALLDIHEIFFIIPVSERMTLITMSRQLKEERRLRESHRSSHDGTSMSHPRISKATLKARERKRKAQLAEEAVFGSVEFRPKSAPATSSPHTSTDLSGPLRRHYHSLFVRALRPIQGQISPIHPDGQITVREMKDRPKTAGEKQKSGTTGNKSKKTAGSKTAKTSSKSTSATSTTSKSKPTSVAPSKTKKMDKAWR